MKRSYPLTRRTPLTRKKRINPMSKKKRKELAETNDLRHWYIEAGYPCQVCRQRPSLEAHEITAGSHRHRAVYDQDAQLYVCAECHDELQGTPYTYQVSRRVEAIVRSINACHGSNAVSLESIGVQLIRWNCTEDDPQ